MAFDFKKEFKEYYLPPCKPEIVNIPPANFIAVRGSGNPNDEDGNYNEFGGYGTPSKTDYLIDEIDEWN
jgi:hypothetical protein